MVDYIPLDQKGAANGVATLDASQKLPVAQLPGLTASQISYQRPAAGAVTLTAYNRFQKTRELTDFIPQSLWAGIANNTNTTPLDAYIAAAIADLNGGRLRVPEGHYLHGATLDFRGLTAIEIMGGNPTGTFFRPSFGSGPVMDFGADVASLLSGVNIHGVGVLSSTPRVAGAAFRFRNVTKVCIENFWVANQAIGVEIGTGCSDTSIGGAGKANIINPTATTGLGVLISGGTLTILRDVLIEGNQSTQGLGGIKITNAGDVNLRDCSTTYSRDGLIIEPASGQLVEHVFMSGNTFDFGVGDGAVLRGAGTIRVIESRGDWVASNANCGFHLSTGPTIQNVDISGLKALNNGNEGVLAENCVGYFGLFNSLIAGNSTDAPNLYPGVRITTGVPKFLVNGNRMGQSGQFDNPQGYGMRVNAGAYTQYSIIGNDFSDNALGALSDEGTATTRKHVKLNLPYSD